jgi:hypothetical protein
MQRIDILSKKTQDVNKKYFKNYEKRIAGKK